MYCYKEKRVNHQAGPASGSTSHAAHGSIVSEDWRSAVKRMSAVGKIKTRKAAKNWDGFCTRDLRNGFILEPEDAEGPDSIKGYTDILPFYEQITENLQKEYYWIYTPTYATGDYTSLSAAVINSPYHGICMYPEVISGKEPTGSSNKNTFKFSNLMMLKSFLGGQIDSEGDIEYIITDDGAKGTWSDKPSGQHEKKTDIESKSYKTLDSLKNEAITNYEHAESELKYMVDCVASTPLDIKGAEEPKSEHGMWEFNLYCRDEYMRIGQIYEKAISFIKQTLTRLRNEEDTSEVTMFEKYLAKSEQNHEICIKRSRQFDKYKIKFTVGTKMIANNWNKDWRQNVRRAWGVEDGKTYDSQVESWLLLSYGIDAQNEIKGKKIFVFWIRKSGERGGAHYENDTSFKMLDMQIREKQKDDVTIILAGDDKLDASGNSKAEKLADPNRHTFNLTQFWKKPEQQSWRADNSRTGQFRLYDYLNRAAASLVHIGAMSGNLEAMALLGHDTVVHASSSDAPGVSRMLAYERHDSRKISKKSGGLFYEKEDMLNYNFQYINDIFGGRPYEKKAAYPYMQLKLRTRDVVPIIQKAVQDALFQEHAGKKRQRNN